MNHAMNIFCLLRPCIARSAGRGIKVAKRKAASSPSGLVRPLLHSLAVAPGSERRSIRIDAARAQNASVPAVGRLQLRAQGRDQ